VSAQSAPGCRYGEEAGRAVQKGMGIAVDAYDVYGAYRQVRIKALAKAFVKGAISKEEAVEAGLPAHETVQLEPGVQLVEPLPQDASITSSPPPGYVPPSSAAYANSGPGAGATAPYPAGAAHVGAGPGAAAAPGSAPTHPSCGNVPLGSAPGASGAAKPPHV
jgi:hypothetical protein